jgi:hypothetical protein
LGANCWRWVSRRVLSRTLSLSDAGKDKTAGTGGGWGWQLTQTSREHRQQRLPLWGRLGAAEGVGKDFAVGGIVWAQRHRLPSVAHSATPAHAHRRSGPPSPTRHLNNTTCIECDISSTNYTPLPSPPKYARMSATTTSGCSHAAISAASSCRFTQSTRHHAEPHMAGDGLPVSACLRKLLMPNGTGQ